MFCLQFCHRICQHLPALNEASEVQQFVYEQSSSGQRIPRGWGVARCVQLLDVVDVLRMFSELSQGPRTVYNRISSTGFPKSCCWNFPRGVSCKLFLTGLFPLPAEIVMICPSPPMLAWGFPAERCPKTLSQRVKHQRIKVVIFLYIVTYCNCSHLPRQFVRNWQL